MKEMDVEMMETTLESKKTILELLKKVKNKLYELNKYKLLTPNYNEN